MAIAGDHVQVLVDGYDLTGDMNNVSMEDTNTMLEVTTFGDTVQNFLAGQRNLKLMHRGFMNAAAARAHPVLEGVSINGAVSVMLGQNADPVAGDPVYSLSVRQEKYGTLPEVNQAIPFDANFVGRGLNGGWGVVLAPLTTISDSTTGSSLNNGAASSNGAAAYLHLLQAAATDTYSIIIEGSATGAFSGEETTLATFSADASAIGSERQTMPGTVPQYLRYVTTRTGAAGDDVQFAIAVIRF